MDRILPNQGIMRTGSPGHLKGFDYVGIHRYSLTFCTHNRSERFTDSEAVTLALGQISRAADEKHFAIIVYCFMPDHMHMLVEGIEEDSDCKCFMTRAKQYSGFHYSRTFHRVLWQRYGFEHVLRDEERTAVVARYILENPVRAGLVEQVSDYPFVGSFVYSLKDLLAGLPDRSG